MTQNRRWTDGTHGTHYQEMVYFGNTGGDDYVVSQAAHVVPILGW